MMPTLLRVSRLARVHLSEECVPVLGTAAPGWAEVMRSTGTPSVSLSQVLLPQNPCSNVRGTVACLNGGKKKAALCSDDRTRHHFLVHVKVTGSFLLINH
jgi:hypothetical protein